MRSLTLPTIEADHSTQMWAALFLLTLIAAIVVPELAHAQAAGGQATGLLAWVTTNIGRPMLNAGILLIAFILLCARASLSVIGMVAAGGLTFANYAQISNFFGF